MGMVEEELNMNKGEEEGEYAYETETDNPNADCIPLEFTSLSAHDGGDGPEAPTYIVQGEGDEISRKKQLMIMVEWSGGCTVTSKVEEEDEQNLSLLFVTQPTLSAAVSRNQTLKISLCLLKFKWCYYVERGVDMINWEKQHEGVVENFDL
ncbi:hypothetical protein P8452_77359 [Trifolium repens]|nr:hypothetical protein P8452_77359 [Trifolium repens]